MHTSRWFHTGLVLAAAYGLWVGQVVGDPAQQQSEWHRVQLFTQTVEGQTPQQQCETAKVALLKTTKTDDALVRCEARE